MARNEPLKVLFKRIRKIEYDDIDMILRQILEMNWHSDFVVSCASTNARVNIVNKKIEPINADRFAINDSILIGVDGLFCEVENSLMYDIDMSKIMILTIPEMIIPMICIIVFGSSSMMTDEKTRSGCSNLNFASVPQKLQRTTNSASTRSSTDSSLITSIINQSV